MEKERLIFLAFLLPMSCASHHPRGKVLYRTSATEGVMKVESDAVKASDKLRIVRSDCYLGVRGNLICRNDHVGEASVETDPYQGQARFRTPASVDFKENDVLEPLQ